MAWGHDHHDHDHDHNLEVARRRRIWWASLTDEERTLEARRQKAVDWWFTCTFGITTVLVLVYAVLVYLGVVHHEIIERILAYAAFPLGLLLSGAFALYKRGQVK